MTNFDAPLHPDAPAPRGLADNPGEAILRAEYEAVRAEDAALADEYRTLVDHEEAQQDGRGMTRRSFVVGSAATVTAMATTQLVSTRASFGATPGGTLIHVFLYGGVDGLSIVAPASDPVLQKVRPQFLLPENGAIAVGRGFALSSAFAPLQGMISSGNVAFIPGVSDPRLSRSHFQSADACNLGGLPNETGGNGWLDNLVDALGPGTAFRSVGIGSTLPRSLVGKNNALALNTVGSFNINGSQNRKAPTINAIRGLFTGINHPLEDAVASGLSALTTAQQLAANGYTPAEGVTYKGVGNQFKELAHLIKGGANVRVATIGMGGYDTHENQGANTAAGGYLFNRLNELAQAMASFFTDLGPKGSDVTVLVSTEFGRRVAQNGTGFDHGHGSVIILVSGKKVSGPLLGQWGGLGSLDNGDVPEFNNMFDIYGSVAKGRFGLTDAEVTRMFPRRKFTPVALYA